MRTQAWQLLVSIAILALVACGGSDSTPATPSSDAMASSESAAPGTVVRVEFDGHVLTMDIPDSALPDGVQREDIEITSLVAEPGFAEDGPAPFAAFRLKPDGLQLREPVTLEIQFPAEESPTGLGVMHIHGKTIEFIEVGDVTLDPNTGIVTVSATISHFSDVVLFDPGDILASGPSFEPVTVELSQSADEVVFGDSFRVRGTGTWGVEPGQTLDFTLGHHEGVLVVEEASWSMEGELKTMAVYSSSSPLSPSHVVDVPAETRMAATVTMDEELTCTSRGLAYLTYLVTATYRIGIQSHRLGPSNVTGRPYYTLTDTLDAHLERIPATWLAFEWGSGRVTCVMPRILASAAPPLTTYSLSPEFPAGVATSFGWSGADCGSVTGSTTSTMVWSHGDEDCEHAGVAHPTTEISVLVTGTLAASGEAFELRCTYVSAASGQGSECAPPVAQSSSGTGAPIDISGDMHQAWFPGPSMTDGGD